MLTLTDMETFREGLLKLVEKFDKDKSHYLSKGDGLLLAGFINGRKKLSV